MKKILLALSALTVIATAGSFEEDKKACDNNDLKGCLNLMGRYSEGDGVKKDLYQAYQSMSKISSILQKKCEDGNKKSCASHNTMKEQLNILPAAFSTDGVFSGMSQDELLFRKFEKGENGYYKVQTGELDYIMSQFSGGKITGSFLSYDTKILGKKASVYVFLTEKTKKVYAVIVEWNFAMGQEEDFATSVKDALREKYDVGRILDKDELSRAVFLGKEWKPNSRATVNYYMSMNQAMGINHVITYIDTKYVEENKQKSKLTKTDKL